MKKLFKNIFYIIFAVCFLSAGLLALNASPQTQETLAEETSSQEISNSNLPEYFNVTEKSFGDISNEFVSSNIFAYSTGKSLSLSLETNGSGVTNEIYQYVYYPTLEDSTIFNFYVINSVGLTINGVAQNITKGNYVTNSTLAFPNYPANPLETFSMVFDELGEDDNAISILDGDGKVIEGVYTLSLDILLVTCTDGTTDTSEATFRDERLTITYNFYVVDKLNYLTNNMPNIVRGNFDNIIQTNNDALYDYYLYSNYTGKGSQNTISYIDYDFTRYELHISKNLENLSYVEKLLYDIDSDSVVTDGDNLVAIRIIQNDNDGHLCRVFFNDIGNYAITYKDILLISNNGTEEKHALTGISNVTKRYMIYVFGYQANYTDMDGEPDENNIRPLGELKTPNYTTGTFSEAADITSAYINSNDAYSQDAGSTTFLISKISTYLTDNDVTPVQTNQTPVKFTANALLSSVRSSYIYTTTHIDGWVETDYLLNGQHLYRKNFTGQAEGTIGTYIYIIAYTFGNYRSSAATQSPDKIFYQVFYFEINKDIPSVDIVTDEDTPKDVQTYTNKSVRIYDKTKESPYNKDVTIRIYAKNFNGQFLNTFGGEYGISYEDLLVNENDDYIVLSKSVSAHYTIRLYYTNQVTSENIRYSSNADKIREISFTIDSIAISNIAGTNVSEIINSSNYRVGTAMAADNFTTNQNFVVSWDNKASGAETFAYYRYFEIKAHQYYNNTYVSALISQMFGQSANTTYLPIDYVLDMNTQNNSWNAYKGNSLEQIETGFVSSEYVFSDGGLYLIDVYDEAGNHAVKAFLLDYTSPIFALFDSVERKYSIPNSSCYISNQSTIRWGKNKALYVQNLEDEPFFSTYNPNTEGYIPAGSLFETYEGAGHYSHEIYEELYNALKIPQYLCYLTISDIPTGQSGSDAINQYTGVYLTIPTENVYYFMNNGTTYTQKSGQTSEVIHVDTEMTYRVLIRDTSNTKYVIGLEESTALQNYTQYYSAMQKVTVSFDSSQLKIVYEDGDGSIVDITDLGKKTSGTTEIDGDEVSKTTFYLNPTNLNRAFQVQFTPTVTDVGATIQVESLTINYYPYVDKYVTATGSNGEEVTFYYSELSTTPTKITIYTYNGEPTTEELTEQIRLNADGYTMDGKYEITRVYSLDSAFTHNDNDSVVRTFVLFVDRNEIISNPKLVGTGSASHLESIVGGDIFVSMYDNGTSKDLVVSFPEVTTGSLDGSSLYNTTVVSDTMTEIPRTILTTNMLPVRIYVPRYKYTSYVEMIEDSNGYHYKVNFDDHTNYYDKNDKNEIVPEYQLYARLYKNSISASNLIAQTSIGALNNNFSNLTFDANGFLEFRKADGSVLKNLTDAGVYFVQITQGIFEPDFAQSKIFAFEIKKTNPDFVAYTTSGTELNSVEQPSSQVKEVYYTNQSVVSLVWDAGSKYIAEIDVEKIRFVPSTGYDFNIDEVWIDGEPTKSNNSWMAKISLEKLGVYRNGAYVDITMQYKNHVSGLYNTVTKRIVVDLSAPTENINTLVENSIGNGTISTLTANALRSRYTVDMNTTTENSTTSFNLSNSSGSFAYYSYYVTADFLTTLKTNQSYKTYIREFRNKYVTGIEQETAPAEFLPTNFKEVDTLSSLPTQTYYEVVELDMAGNMTIYTIYVADYSVDRDIISYTSQGEKAYTTEDYNLRATYNGATHNIYSKTGFTLTGVDYFGDAWAQITLTKVGQSSNSLLYLMLTPWDTAHAYAFANGTSTALDFSSLIDGSYNSSYKNALKFYNRQKLTTDTIYVNVKNTDLPASMTETQDREYIRFSNVPTDNSINNTTYASTYLTALQITVQDTNTILYDETNLLGYASLWKSNDNVTVTHNSLSGQLTFELKTTFAPNTRIVYNYTNNYGTTYTEIHLYKETIIPKEITSEYELYGYYLPNGNLYYVTQNGFQYNYNRSKYSVSVYGYNDGVKTDEPLDVNDETYEIHQETRTVGGITTLTLQKTTDKPYSDTFMVEVKDPTSELIVKTVYVTLYNMLPTKNFSNDPNSTENGAGQFKLLDATRTNITANITESLSASTSGYFSEVILMYTLADTFIPVKFSYSTDGETWTEAQSGTIFKNASTDMVKYYLKVWYDEAYIENEIGSAEYLFQYVPSEQIYEFNLSSLTATYWIEKTIDGVTTVVEKSGTIFRTADGKQYSNHYIVNLDYASRSAIQIKTNEEQGIVIIGSAERLDDGTSSVASERYYIANSNNPDLATFSTYIVITYIPTTDTPVNEFYTYNTNGVIDHTENLISLTSKSFVVPQDSTSISKIELQWTKYNGIEYNEIKIAILKDGVEINPTIFTKKTDGKSYNYCYLTYSGKYIISLYDTAGNIQKFNYQNSGQSDRFTLTFLKDVPFTVAYTNPETSKEEVSLPIKQAIYNGSVALCIDTATQSEFYAVGGYPTLTIYRNGVKLGESDYDVKTENGKKKFIFSKSGYYEYSFSATSNITNVGTIRQESYQFTIINPNEYKYSYILNKYSNYYIEKVVRNGKDITQTLLNSLEVATIRVNQELYLAELPLSYLNENTGSGIYFITVNSNEKYFTSEKLPTSWTYQVTIQVGTAPIKVSAPQGEPVSSAVTIVYNAANIYQEMGECTIQLVKYTADGHYVGVTYKREIDESSTGKLTVTIQRGDYGTFYVQVVSPSNAMMYSYKVLKSEPMNAASIIAIVAAALVLVVVVIIVIRLRKKIAVK